MKMKKKNKKNQEDRKKKKIKNNKAHDHPCRVVKWDLARFFESRSFQGTNSHEAPERRIERLSGNVTIKASSPAKSQAGKRKNCSRKL